MQFATQHQVFTGLLLAAILIVVGTQSAAAADPVRGQDEYKEYCKGCHTSSSPHGEYTPMSLIQSQWIRFFDKRFERTHKDVTDSERDNKPITESIPPDVLEAIRDFAVEHAADTENPMTCG